MHKKPILLAENLAYEIRADRILFEKVNVSIEDNHRIALVGRNGVGKSTLLKIFASQIRPTTGSVKSNGVIYYLPQISTIQESIKADTVFNFLNSSCDEWWKIGDILETKFSTSLDLSLSLTNLSGGELTKLFLAVGLSQKPNLLLLDEPTNHMDLFALETLSSFLNDFNGALVIVSHKPFFLDRVTDITWELTPEGMNVYGGNFSFYRDQKHTEAQVVLRNHEVAKKELKRSKNAVLKEQQRAAQSQIKGHQKFLSGSIGKLEAGNLKRKAQVSGGIAKKKHETAVAKATQRLQETKVKTTKSTSIQIQEKSHKSRNLINIQGANLNIGNRLLIENIHLHISSGDRVALSGGNGSGKSSLIKAILGANSAVLESGEVLLAPNIKAVYLDQTYELVNREQTILENMQAVNSNLNYQLLRQQLGHFLFKNDDVNKSASVLSGGELARLAIAIISISEIDLLILDEPTNNLDIETVDQMVEGINEFRGALWVISHDLDFLSRINVNKAFNLSKQALQMTAYLPTETKQFYQELLH